MHIYVTRHINKENAAFTNANSMNNLILLFPVHDQDESLLMKNRAIYICIYRI